MFVDSVKGQPAHIMAALIEAYEKNKDAEIIHTLGQLGKKTVYAGTIFVTVETGEDWLFYGFDGDGYVCRKLGPSGIGRNGEVVYCFEKLSPETRIRAVF